MANKREDLGLTETAPAGLERTATAPLSSSAPASPPEPLGATLGRYRLERELGAGGMGVVHAAFDPDLERRIALKVLRVAGAGTEAKDRLLREARAMARLVHTNVVTVYEVGTAGGRDYVAMELILGETLADWLRAKQRDPGEIIDAFVAAGRGLAAAHAAGIVHRDFKPHNVLRSRDGRIVVTDFGLAREATADLPSHLEETLPLGPRSTTETTTGQSSLAGITVTGSLLGTPAYMAPEQWSGGAVTPATDQFAYCVALWEALVGERPYRGPTLDDLRAQVARGPGALDVSKLPRRLRATLRRGLDPDPARRWPSMDTLLARVVRAERRPGVALALASGAFAVAATVIVFTRGDSEPACAAPARPLAVVWSPALAAELRAKTSEDYVRAFERDARPWDELRAKACTEPEPVRGAQLACLDGVAARIDVLRQAYARVPGATGEDISAELVDPATCMRTDPPVLSMKSVPETVAAYELFARSETRSDKPREEEIVALLDKPGVDPCATVIAGFVYTNVIEDSARKRERLNDALTAADQCRDERLRADVMMLAAPFDFELPVVGPKGEAAVKRAELAVRRVAQPDMDAGIAQLVAGVARLRNQTAEALKAVERAVDGFGARGLLRRQLFAVALRNELLYERSDPGDPAAIRADAAKWLDAARKVDASPNVQPRLEVMFRRQDAAARFWLGDPEAHAQLVALWRREPHRPPAGGSRTIEGVVVDGAGKPVAGATVASAAILTADSYGVGLPIFDVDGGLRIATTDAAGRFVLEHTSLAGTVQAHQGLLRSVPLAMEDKMKLVLEPTRRLAGKVALGSTPHTRLQIDVSIDNMLAGTYQMIAPIAPDGSFVVEGAPVRALYVGVSNKASFKGRMTVRQLPASTAPVADLELAFASTGRALDVVVRSAVSSPFAGAQVFLLTGHHEIPTMAVLKKWRGAGVQSELGNPIVGERKLGKAADQVRPGDLVAHFTDAPLGEVTVCALGLSEDLLDAKTRERLMARSLELKLKCEKLGGDAKVVIVVAPAQDRFE